MVGFLQRAISPRASGKLERKVRGEKGHEASYNIDRRYEPPRRNGFSFSPCAKKFFAWETRRVVFFSALVLSRREELSG